MRAFTAGLCSALFLCASAISQDYIRNGGFETNAFVQNVATVPDSDLDGATSLADWIAGGASSDVRPDLYRQGSYYNAAIGEASPLDRFFAGLYGPHGDFLEQSFSTTGGTSYLVTFQQSHGAVFDSSVNGWTYNSTFGGVLVHLSGSNVLFDQTFTPSGPVVPADAVGPIPNGLAGLWEERSFSFTADSDSTTIRFTGTGDGTQFLDDVTLSPLPSTNPPALHIAYVVPAGTVGNQILPANEPQSEGMDFEVNTPISISSLGVFDSSGDGLTSALTVQLYDRDTRVALAQLTFAPTNAGTLIGGSRFRALATPLRLESGFHGVIAVDYTSQNNEPTGNLRAGPGGWTTDNGGGAISFVGSGRIGYGTAAIFPDLVVSGCPANCFAAGTFMFASASNAPPTIPSNTVAYVVPAGTVGNQFLPSDEPRSLGMDFDVNAPTLITSLGVFDSGGDGLRSPLTAHIYNRDTLVLLVTLTFTPTNSGVLIDGSRFLALETPWRLEAGFHGVIAVDYIAQTNEPNGNLRVSTGGWTMDSGGGLISFVGSGRVGYGTGAIFPDLVVSGCPANCFAAGTFMFASASNAPPTIPSNTVAYVVPAGTVGNQFLPAGEPRSLGMDFGVNAPTLITSLGVFDSGGDGLRSPLTAHIYNRDTLVSLVTLTFTPTNSGVLIAGSRFLPLETPLRLEAGFHGVVAVDYIAQTNEMNGNLRVSAGGWTMDGGGGLISFVGSGRVGYGTGAIFPDVVVSGCPANCFAAGTFMFASASNAPPTIPSNTVAYVVPEGTLGNQFLPSGEPQSLGMDFDVSAPILITSLGVFDSGGDGLRSSLTAHIYNRDTRVSLVKLTFTPGNSGTLIGGSRFLPLETPLRLEAGFHGVVAVDYIAQTNEPNGNLRVSAGGWTTESGGGLISFVGSSRHSFMGTGAVFPDIVEDNCPANCYAAGTFMFGSAPALSAPAIFFFAPTSGPIGASVTITGTNFSATAADDIVYFGAVRAAVTAASTTALTVNVPLGATYAAPCVTVGGLTACANAPFGVIFPSSGTLDATSLSPRLDLPGGDGPMQVVIADLDGDGKSDLAMVSRYDSILSLYRNISASGSLTPASWSLKIDFPTTLDPVHLVAADVDGDGKLDLVVVNHTSGVVAGATDTVSIFLNTSTPGSLNSNSFAARIDYPAGLAPLHVAVGDLDGDGRPDLAVANFYSGTVSLLQNRSTPGHIDFAPKMDFTAATGLHTVEMADLDGDGKLDLVAGNHENDTTSVWRNTSTPGTIGPDSFAPRVDFAGSGKTIAIGDLDGDGKPDLVAGSWRLGRLSIFRNTSTVGAIDAHSFAPRVELSADGYAHTVVIGDLDGDGRPDLALVTEMPSHLSLFQNLSSPGSFTPASFGPRIDFGSGWNAVGVAIGDLDGDGKPDLAFANHYDDSITIYRNVIPLTAPPSRTLALASPSPGQEGTTISVPLELISEGDVGGMTFVLHYDQNYLRNAILSWSPLLEGPFTTVNYAAPGEIHATFAFSGDAVPSGTQLLANVNFLLRSVPTDLDTGLSLEILDVSSPVGDPITVGNLTRNASAHITKRLILADNNANQRLDVGDATVILRFLTQLDTPRPWDVAGNDLNSNQNLDTGDAIKVLRAAAGVDPQPGGSPAPALLQSASPKSSSLLTELMLLSPVTQRGQALDLVTFRVQLQSVHTAISGASITFDYPTNALRLLNSQFYRFGGLVPAGSLAVWNVSPAQNNFAIQDGHLSLAVSSASPWPASNGVLAELTFQVQSGATNRYAWPLVLRGGEISPDGFRNRFLLPSAGVFIGRDPLPGVLAVLGRSLSNQFQFSLTGDAGASYTVEVSTNLVNWAPMTNIINHTGSLTIVDGETMSLPHRFYRTRPVE